MRSSTRPTASCVAAAASTAPSTAPRAPIVCRPPAGPSASARPGRPSSPTASTSRPASSSTPSARSGTAAREDEPETLASCYRNALSVADEVGAHSVAFPAISTGVFGYPADRAAEVAVTTVRAADTDVTLVRFVAFDDGDTPALSPPALR